MQREVRLSDEAIRQIEANGDYIARRSPENALHWIKKIHAEIKKLSEFAEHAVLYTAEQAGREVRQTFFGVYRILYEVRGNAVFVLTVRHGARRPIGPEEVAGIV